MEDLPLSFADVMQCTCCDHDLGEVLLGKLEAGGGGAPAALEAGKDTLYQDVGPAQVVVKVGLAGVQEASTGLHQPRLEQEGRVPNEQRRDDGTQMQIWHLRHHEWCMPPTAGGAQLCWRRQECSGSGGSPVAVSVELLQTGSGSQGRSWTACRW